MLYSVVQYVIQYVIQCCTVCYTVRYTVCFRVDALTSVPMSCILCRASSLRFPCSTPELTRGMGMSLGGGGGYMGGNYILENT